MKSFNFYSNFLLGAQTLPDFDQETVKDEPMLFRADLSFALRNGGPITHEFIQNLPRDWLLAKDLTIDSRVHMLMEGWYPCIPGWHHDDVPRTREDKQPNYRSPGQAKHVMALFGLGPATDFALGGANFDEVPIGEIVYKTWHSVVESYCQSELLTRRSAPFREMIYFDNYTWHQGTKSKVRGFRFFIRASKDTGRLSVNEIRRNANVYMEFPMEGW